MRYADDFSIYCESKAEAKRAGNSVYIFLRDKLKLPINREKSGIRRPVNFQILGFGFLPIYKKGVKGQYQLVITKKKWKEVKIKLKEITRKTKPLSFDMRIRRLQVFLVKVTRLFPSRIAIGIEKRRKRDPGACSDGLPERIRWVLL